MNILFLMGIYPSYGGVEKVTTVLANEFVKQGMCVSIVSFEQPVPELAKELHPKIKLYKLDYPVLTNKNKVKLSQIIRNNDVKYLINQWAVPWYVARLCKKATIGTECRLITVHHNIPNMNARIQQIEIDLSEGKGNRLINRLKHLVIKSISRISLRYVYETSDRYIVLSPSFVPILGSYILKKNLPKVIALGNPITISDIDSTNYHDKINEIIYVGRVEYNQKHTYRLIDVWNTIRLYHPDWHLTIVGDGPDLVNLKGRATSMGLENINFEGFQSPLNYYKRAKILLLLSEYEGFPLVIGEAMSQGTVPVILGSFPAVYDIVKNCSGIVIKPPYNIDVVAEALSGLMQDAEKLRTMSSKSIEISKEFELHSIIKEWKALFNSIM